LGNLWDRSNMIGAAIATAKVAKATGFQTGPGNLAVGAAICCQIKNPAARACLLKHQQAVWNWLLSH
jgi:hypothetical protein